MLRKVAGRCGGPPTAVVRGRLRRALGLGVAGILMTAPAQDSPSTLAVSRKGPPSPGPARPGLMALVTLTPPTPARACHSSRKPHGHIEQPA